MITSAKEAREIIDAFLFKNGGKLSDWDSDKFEQSRGYLSALEGPECRALVEALEKIRRNCTNPDTCETVDKVLSQYRKAVKP